MPSERCTQPGILITPSLRTTLDYKIISQKMLLQMSIRVNLFD